MDLTTFASTFHEHYSGDPNDRVFLGINRDLGMLPDPSIAAIDARVARARELLLDLEQITISTLDFDDALDVRLARLKLEREIHDNTYMWNGRRRLAQQPTAGDGIGDGMFMLFINDPRPAEDRLADITSRMEQVPAFVDAMLARLDHPIARWVTIDAAKCKGLPEMFDTLLEWAGQVDFADKDRLAVAIREAKPALESFVKQLTGLPTVTNIHLGHDTMVELLRLRGLRETPEELHTMASEFLADTRATLAELKIGLATKHELPKDISVEDLHSFLNQKYRLDVGGDVDRVLDAYNTERSKVLSFCRDRDLFPILSNQDMKILRTPRFMAPSIPAGAMMPPAPFRDGVSTSLVYLTLSEELLDEHTELTIPNMMIHEGIPGHHLQLATASRHPSLIRRHTYASDHAEGWTTMLEDYMLDLGYAGELSDEVRFCAKRDISRLGARVAIDLFFMSGDRKYLDVGIDCDTSSEDPFEAAKNLLIAVTGFVPGRAQAELNWYSQERGYPLSYLAGNHAVWGLKKRLAENNVGRIEGMDLDRKFHEVYLHAGAMPVSFLDAVFEHQGLL